MQLDAEIVESFTKIKEFQTTQRSKLSELDKKISDYYHAIDLLDLPAHKLAQVVKQLKATLRERRDLKHTTAFVNNIMGNPNVSVKSALKQSNSCAQQIKKNALRTYNEVFANKGEIK